MTRSWRLATAVRAFGLAFVLGLLLSNRGDASSALVLGTLAVIALVASGTELTSVTRADRWFSTIEGLVVATLVGTTGAETLLPYLVVPSVVAGVRHGWVSALNTSLLVLLAVVVGTVSTQRENPDLGAILPWGVLGVGAGLLAGWQTRTMRQLEARQAPYAAAHQLIAQLHRLTGREAIGFDPISIAQGIVDELRSRSGAVAAAVVTSDEDGSRTTLLGAVPDSASTVDLSTCLQDGGPRHDRATAYLPIRLNDRTIGVVVLGGGGPWDEKLVATLQAIVDSDALRLETALLFGEMRDRATSEERGRLARDLHDGVAQEIVALGYLIDELEDQVTDPGAVATASSLRHEVHRILGDLRFSVFDLRHETVEGGLADSLATYAREVSASSAMDVHLSLDDVGQRLPHRVESEMLRIAQEAIGNARRHAHARNLWIYLSALDDAGVGLHIADDGVGGATALTGHYGMHTMRERAELIGAQFSCASRAGGGTVVTVTRLTDAASPTPFTHDLHSPAGR